MYLYNINNIFCMRLRRLRSCGQPMFPPPSNRTIIISGAHRLLSKFEQCVITVLKQTNNLINNFVQLRKFKKVFILSPSLFTSVECWSFLCSSCVAVHIGIIYIFFFFDISTICLWWSSKEAVNAVIKRKFCSFYVNNM